MTFTETNNPKIRFAEGDVFATSEYEADGLIVFSCKGFNPLHTDALFYKGDARYIHHSFRNRNQSRLRQRCLVMRYLRELTRQGCGRIGIHCSAHINDSAIEGARICYEAVRDWVRRNPEAIGWITLVDKQGDYNRFLQETDGLSAP